MFNVFSPPKKQIHFFYILCLIIKKGYCQQYLVNILFCIKNKIVNDLYKLLSWNMILLMILVIVVANKQTYWNFMWELGTDSE